jgi:hypothetical protein
MITQPGREALRIPTARRPTKNLFDARSIKSMGAALKFVRRVVII